MANLVMQHRRSGQLFLKQTALAQVIHQRTSDDIAHRREVPLRCGFRCFSDCRWHGDYQALFPSLTGPNRRQFSQMDLSLGHLGTEANPTDESFIPRPLKRLVTGDKLLPE
jgi:hypothetical protein